MRWGQPHHAWGANRVSDVVPPSYDALVTAAASCSSRSARRALSPCAVPGPSATAVPALVREVERVWRRGGAGQVLVLVSSASVVLWITTVVAALAFVLGG